MKMDSNTDRKRATRNSVYRYLYECKGFCSRQTLANELGLSLPTVYQNLSELMEMGLVCATDEKLSTGGRRVEGLSIVSDARVAVGVSITDHRLRISEVDLKLNELAYKKVTMRKYNCREEYARAFSDEIETFLDEFKIDRERLLGIGVALPGVVSPDGSRLEYAPTLGVLNTSLDVLKTGLPYQIHAENDANCGGGAEWFLRDSASNIAYVSLEEGIGGAVFGNGFPYFGDNHRSGEFGHICVEPGGLKCSCGRQGCLEAYCSARRISNDLGITVEEFSEGLKQGNIEYSLLWENFLQHLAIGISNIRMVLDCDVVLGGFMSEYLENSLPRLKEYLAALNPFEPNADYVCLSRRKHTIPMGAALYFVKKFIEEL